MTDTLSYRSYLREILINKKKANSQFSLRSFSKVLGIQPTFLSYVLNGKRDLSDNMVAQFIERLKLKGKEAKIFELLVKVEKAKHPSLKNKILESLKEMGHTQNDYRDLTVENFMMISEWYHYAIFMLIDITDFKWTIPTVASIIGVSTHEVRKALERLEALDLIKMQDDSRPIKLETRIIAKSKTPSEAIRTYQLKILEMTRESFENVSAQERFNGSELVTLSSEQLSEAAEIFEECFERIFSLARKEKSSKNVYQVGIHLFPITQIKRSKK